MNRQQRTRALLWTLAAALVLAVMPGPARAQSESEYQRIIVKAVTEYDLGHYEEAQAQFRRVHELAPSARTWRGLGLCAFELRQYVEADMDLEAALRDTRKPLTPELREHALQVLEMAEDYISVYHLRVNPAGAELVLDGKPTPLRDGQLRLNPGAHSLLVRAPGYEERQAEIRAGAGVKEELSIELSLVAARAGSAQAQSLVPHESASSARPARSARRLWTWSLAGASVAAAALAVGLRIDVSHLRSEFRSCTRAMSADCQAVKRTGRNVLHGSYISAGFAGAFLLGAASAFVLEARHADVAVGLSPSGLQLHGRF